MELAGGGQCQRRLPADAGIVAAGATEWSCTDAKSLVALSRGDFGAAICLAATAAQLAVFGFS